MRLARAEVLDPGQVQVAHVYNRTVRRCFLFGDDPLTGKNYDHRKQWIEEALEQLAAAFGIDLLAFAILSNHFHLILRTRPDVVAQWDDREVARRWLLLCPHRRDAQGRPLRPSQQEILAIANCSLRREEIRRRLSNISWWMRLLCQRIAMRANREEGETGRFFQDRFRATRLVDEASLLACSAYVDLNPIRAAICQTLQGSEHTSVQRRIEARDPASPGNRSGLPPVERLTADAFLAPLSVDERTDPTGPNESKLPSRCSDRGYLGMSLEDYLNLLDWTARQVSAGKSGHARSGTPPILQRLGIHASTWFELSSRFGRLYSLVAGSPPCVDALRSHQTQRRFHLRRPTRAIFSSA